MENCLCVGFKVTSLLSIRGTVHTCMWVISIINKVKRTFSVKQMMITNLLLAYHSRINSRNQQANQRILQLSLRILMVIKMTNVKTKFLLRVKMKLSWDQSKKDQ
jgi:hypothetical protein